MTPEKQWRVTATFENREQAKQAAEMLTAMHPHSYTFAYHEDGKQVWYETGATYLARNCGI